MFPGQQSRYCRTGDLLPVTARLLVPHEKVLVIDTGEMKSQTDPVYLASPHQTGVTERSISGRYRHPANHVVDDVVV